MNNEYKSKKCETTTDGRIGVRKSADVCKCKMFAKMSARLLYGLLQVEAGITLFTLIVNRLVYVVNRALI